ncbi:LptA/OstA family protein [Anaeroselena agilis]|uniref:LptA/OstA family protein n=1 Tax=Anaeroselena agilis TaxID=3063788 RepID=A0ABU3NZR4_9FIRM|nr:LptA/OstA family protein [Selenomonadales bacterium 4137-cl]
MKQKTLLVTLLALLLLTGIACASPSKPVIKADKTYFDVNTGLYVLKGNVYIEVKDRIITAGMARVSIASLEVWGTGGVTVTQGDIYFSGQDVYVFGLQDRAKIDGGVTFKRTGLSITADRVEFNWRSKIGVFSGNVGVTQNDATWTADRVTYNVETNAIVQPTLPLTAGSGG